MENKIFHKEKEILVTIISLLVIPSVYAVIVYSKFLAANPELINNFKFWGKTLLILVPIMIVSIIIVHIIFFIINRIVTNEEFPKMTDEMDQLIDLKAIKKSRWLNSLGFLLALVSQALGMPAWVLIATILVFGILSGVFEGLLKIYFYRKGV